MTENSNLDGQPLQKILGQGEGQMKEQQEKTKKLADTEGRLHQLRTHITEQQARELLHESHRTVLSQMLRGGVNTVDYASLNNVAWQRARYDRILAMNYVHTYDGPNTPGNNTSNTLVTMFRSRFGGAQTISMERVRDFVSLTDRRLQLYTTEIPLLSRYASALTEIKEFSEKKINGKTLLEHIQSPELIQSLEKRKAEGGDRGTYAGRRLDAARTLGANIPERLKRVAENRETAFNSLERLHRIQTLTQLLAIKRGSTGNEGLEGSLSQIYGADPDQQVARKSVQSNIDNWIKQLTEQITKTEPDGAQLFGPDSEERLAQRGDDLIGSLRTAAQDAVVDNVNGQPNATQSVDALVSDFYQAQTIVAYENMQNSPQDWDTWWPQFRDGLRNEMQRQTNRDAFNAAMLASAVTQGPAGAGMLPENQTDRKLVEAEMKRQGVLSPMLEQQMGRRWQVYSGAMSNYSQALRGIVNATGGRPPDENAVNPQNWMQMLWNERGSGAIQNVVTSRWNVFAEAPLLMRNAVWGINRTQLLLIRTPIESLTGQPWMRTRIEGVLKEMEGIGKELNVVDEASIRYRERYGAYGSMIEANAASITTLNSFARADSMTMNGGSPRMPLFVSPAADNDPTRNATQAFAKQHEVYQKALVQYAQIVEKGGSGAVAETARKEVIAAHKNLWDPYIAELQKLYVQETRRPFNLTQQFAKLRENLTTNAQRTAFDSVTQALEKALKEQQESIDKSGNRQFTNEQVFTRVAQVLQSPASSDIPDAIRKQMQVALQMPMTVTWKIEQRIAGAYLALSQEMQNDLIPNFSRGNQQYMQELGLITGRNVADQHLMADTMDAFMMSLAGLGLVQYGRAGGMIRQGGVIGRLANGDRAARLGTRFIMGGSIRSSWGPLNFLRHGINGVNGLVNPLAAVNGVARLGMLDPVTDAVRFFRGVRDTPREVSQILRITNSGRLTLQQQTAQIVAILNHPELTNAMRMQILEELAARGVSINGTARQSLAINSVMRGGSAMTAVQRGDLGIAIMRANGAGNMNEAVVRTIIDNVHSFKAKELEAAYVNLAKAYEDMAKAGGRSTKAAQDVLRAAEKAVTDILDAKEAMLIARKIPASQAKLLVRSAVCGSEGANIAQNIARMPGINVSEEMRTLLSAHIPPANRLSFWAPRPGGAMRLLKASPLLALDGYFVYQSFVELEEARKERETAKKDVREKLILMGFRPSADGDVYRLPGQSEPGKPSRGGIELKMSELLSVHNTSVETRGVNAAAQTGGLLVGLAAAAYGGPVGMILGAGAAAIVVTVNAYGDAQDFNKAYELLGNNNQCPSWLLWLLGGARTLTKKSGMELMEGPGMLASMFAKEAPDAAKNRMLFCAVIEQLQPETRMELLSAANVGSKNPLEAMESLYTAFPVARDFFSAQLFARYPDRVSWDDARNLKIPARPWVFDGLHASALAGALQSTSQMFAAHVLEQNYLRALSLSQQRPEDADLAQQVRMLGRHVVFGATLADRQAALAQNQQPGQSPRTRASLLTGQIRQTIEKTTEQDVYEDRLDPTWVAPEGGRVVRPRMIRTRVGTNHAGDRRSFVDLESMAKAETSRNAGIQANQGRLYTPDPVVRENYFLAPFAYSGIHGIDAQGAGGNFQLHAQHRELWSSGQILSLPPTRNAFALAQWAMNAQSAIDNQPRTLAANATPEQALQIFHEVVSQNSLNALQQNPQMLMGYLPARGPNDRPVAVTANVPGMPFAFLRQENVLELTALPFTTTLNYVNFAAVGTYGNSTVITETMGYTEVGGARKAKQRILFVSIDREGKQVIDRVFGWEIVPATDLAHPGFVAMQKDADEAIETASGRRATAGREYLIAEGAEEGQNGQLTLRGKTFRYVESNMQWQWSDTGSQNFGAVSRPEGNAATTDAQELSSVASLLQTLNEGGVAALEALTFARSIGEQLLTAYGAQRSMENGRAIFMLQKPPEDLRMFFRWNQGKWESHREGTTWSTVTANSPIAPTSNAGRPYAQWFTLEHALGRANVGDMSPITYVQEGVAQENQEAVGDYLKTILGAREETVSGQPQYTITVTHLGGEHSLKLRCDQKEWQIESNGAWIPTEDYPPFTLPPSIIGQQRRTLERVNSSLATLNSLKLVDIISLIQASETSDRTIRQAETKQIAAKYVIEQQQKQQGGFLSNSQMLFSIASGTFNSGANDCLIQLRPDTPNGVGDLAYCLPDGRVLMLRRNAQGDLERRIAPSLQSLGLGVAPQAGTAPATGEAEEKTQLEATGKMMEEQGKRLLDLVNGAQAGTEWQPLQAPADGTPEVQQQFQEQISRILRLPVRNVTRDVNEEAIANIEMAFDALRQEGLLAPEVSLQHRVANPGEQPLNVPTADMLRAVTAYLQRNPGNPTDQIPAFITEMNAHLQAERLFGNNDNKLIDQSAISRAVFRMEQGQPPRVLGQ